MSPFALAWDVWLRYSLLGFIFSLWTWRRKPFISLIYVVGGVIVVFTKFSDPSAFGVTAAEWQGSEYWREVRQYLIIGQLILSGAVIGIESMMSAPAKPIVPKEPEPGNNQTS
jgi:hypothetical protein